MVVAPISQTEYFLPTYLPAQPINTGGGCLLCLVCYVKKSVLFVLKHNTLLHFVKVGTLALNSLGYTPSFFIVPVCDEHQHEELAGV